MSFRKFLVASISIFCLQALAQSATFKFIEERTITGKVKDAGTGKPLEGVIVRAISSPLGQSSESSTTTIADGTYVLPWKTTQHPSLRIEFSKTGWGPDPRTLVADTSGKPQPDVLLADKKGDSAYYKALANNTVQYSVLRVGEKPPQLESILSLPPERKAETLLAIQAANSDVYAGVLAADLSYAKVRLLRETFASTTAGVTADLDWKNPGQVVFTGSVRSASDKAKLLEVIKDPTGKTIYTDNLKIDRSAPALTNYMANQPMKSPRF